MRKKKLYFLVSALVCRCFIMGHLFAGQKPFVTCGIYGQLGNQMHQVATVLAYAWDNNFEPYFPELNKVEQNVSKNRDTIFRKLNNSRLPRPIQYTFKNFFNFIKKPIPFKKDIKLEGFYQTYEYYDHHRDQLIKIFEPEEERLTRINSQYQELINNPNTVAVHIRTFNKYWNNLIPFCGIDYYEEAMNRFPNDMLFVVFSDRVNWCKHHLKNSNKNILYIEPGDYLDDFYLMSMMKHQIIGNSSFSFWAAYLNINPEKIVVAPSHFIRPQSHGKNAAIPPEWIVLNIDLNKPYPADMTLYDEFSQSIDNQ